MSKKPYIFLSPVNALAFEAQSDGKTYRKELIYPGKFIKKDDNDRVEFKLDVDERLIDHWVATFEKMKKNGVEVPLPIEHTTDPEQRRGTVVRLSKEYNPERGTESLYCYVRFRKGAEKLAETSQVSLYAPPTFVDGRGNKYARPIKHVALTDYPLIPGLGKFKAIAASLVLSEESEMTGMTVADLADRLGIEYEDGADEETIAQAIEDAWNEGEDDLIEDEELIDSDELVDDEELVDDDDELIEDDGLSLGDDTEEEFVEDDEVVEDEEPAMSASAVRQVAKAREVQIKGLVADGNITPAVARRLTGIYADRKKVAIALSHGGKDDFENVIAALSQNQSGVRTGSRTGAQDRRGNADGEKSPLVRDAERRAAARTR